MKEQKPISLRRAGLTGLLEHLVPLLALTAVLLAAVAYPLRLHEDVLARLEGAPGWVGWLYHHELRPFLAYTLSPLVLKENLANLVLAVMTCLWLVLRVLRLSSSVPTGSQLPLRDRMRTKLATPEPWIAALILYAVASSLPSILPGFGWLFRSPTPVYSLRTLLPMTLALVMALALLRTARPRATTGKFMGAICIAGALIAAISLLQHIEVRGRWWFMALWENEPRNRVGSLIGHNTGLSSWLLFPLSFSLFYLLSARRLLTRGAAGALALLITFVLVAAQSRAVWGLALVGLPVYLLFQLRALRLRPPMWSWLAGAAAALLIIASQMVAPEKNPFARHDVSLTERLTTDVFNLDQLLRETRLRVVRASMPLVADRPLLGHGLGAFQWVYPPAQGRYFSEGLGTVTGFTVRRTNVAHTDPVQLLVELGLVGVLLTGIPLALVVRMALRARRGAPAPERARINALLFPVAAVALHSWIDFPMHIEPVSLATVTALVLAAGAGRWPGVILPEEQVFRQVPETLPAGGAVSESRPRLRPRYVTALSLAGFSFVLAGYATVFIVRTYVSDIHFVDGTNWINTARVLPESEGKNRFDFLLRARKELRKATHLDPANGEAYEKMAYASGLLGELPARLALQAERSGDSQRAEQMRGQARLNYEIAVQSGIHQLQQGELRWHYPFYLIGQAYRALWKLNPDRNDARQANYLRAAKANLERALEYNIADPASLTELADLLEEQPNSDPARANRLRSLIYRLAPEFAAEYYHEPALRAAEHGDFPGAWRKLERAESVAPGDERLALVHAQVLLRSAVWPPPELDTDPATSGTLEYRRTRLEAMRPILERLSAKPGIVDPDDVLYLRMHHAAARGAYGEALAAADEMVKERPRDSAIKVLRWMLGQRQKQERPLPRELAGTAEAEHYRHRFRMYYFGEVATGAAQLANLAPTDAVQLELFEGLRAAAFLKGIGQWERVAAIARDLKQSFPDDPAVVQLAAEAEKKTAAERKGEAK